MKYKITYDMFGVDVFLIVEKHLLDFTQNNKVTYGPYLVTSLQPIGLANEH